MTPSTTETTQMKETLTFRSPELGDVPYRATDVVRFPQGLPGFERLRDFLIVTREECAPFVFLASLEEPTVALPLLPWTVAAGAHAAALPGGGGRESAGPGPAIACYAVVSIGAQGREVIANLRAPVLVDLDDRTGRQVILADETLPLTAPVK
jgi:flagellar assembly factor FliW